MRNPLCRPVLLLFTLLLPVAAGAADQAGVSAAVRGQVTLARAQAVGRTVASGEGIFLEDKIRSGTRSGMQILLLDETTFTIGPESELIVDEFVFDPQTNSGKMTARVAKGVFRFVTGKIAKAEPSNVNVALPAGNIGIRGTMVAGSVDPVTKGAVVVLLGEGPDNASGDPSGSMDVCNAGACTHVSRPGFGVIIEGQEYRPSPAFRVPEPQVEAILTAVTKPETQLADAPADNRDEAVDTTASADSDLHQDNEEARQLREKIAKRDALDGFTDLAAQDTVTQQGENFAFEKSTGLLDGPTLYDQLRSIPQGLIHYQQIGTPLGSGDNYDMYVDVDFGAQTYGGGNSRLTVSGSRNGTGFFTVPQSYAASQGQASFFFTTNAIIGAGCGTNCTANLTVLPQNANGVVAQRALHQLQVFDFTATQIDGGAGNAPGLPGGSP